MAEYSIGEVEQLTGVKAHVLRYWEQMIPLIRPRKDDQGRRFYQSRDIELLLRVKHLVEQRKFTLEGAGEQLVAELTDVKYQDSRCILKDIRAELLRVYQIARKWTE